MRTAVVVARHGEAEYERSEWDDEGGSLTELGRRQAAALADSLADRGITHVWTSTLSRAVQTGEIVAARLGVAVTTRIDLREVESGSLEEHVGVEEWVAVWDRWMAGDLEPGVPGGETGHQVAARFGAVLREVAGARPGETSLVVAHGGIIRIGVPVLARMDVERAPLDNCDTVELVVDADGWVCTSYGPPSREG
ncbi:histidine phosphatase family protein [Nocardioides anomalus]|uniref:Histidine phosphatase family protein n=1 Tax=Nocardioides anomalus TaxID=2712223 RepID=A0A6G6WB93_9ACTN|nr:histidine phosphatase family protein [Nocardioides anomalus]QIG42427.1 histidine phosphatase family protein [Nocardioides anomalus]